MYVDQCVQLVLAVVIIALVHCQQIAKIAKMDYIYSNKIIHVQAHAP